MATAEELTDPYLSTYVAVPRAGEGVCDLCHGAPNPGFTRCWSCANTMGQVSHPSRLVVPISLTKKTTSPTDTGGQFHDVLRNYKYSHNAEVRQRLGLQVSAVLTRFLRKHSACIAAAAGEPWDYLTITPSTKASSTPHALERAIGMSEDLRVQYRAVLQRGPGELEHNQAADDGYVTTTSVKGDRILVVDDTFTSGARSQSAASALTAAGATVVGIVPIGRFIDTNREAAAALWEAARQVPFSFDVCCLNH
jgi:predicted amidophosphoribosyltransferase